MSEVAVVIPAFVRDGQGLGWLHEAIASVPPQTEIVVVDDASPMRVPPIAGVIVLRHDQQRGPGAARNTAIRAAKANWLLPLDADDLLTPNAIQHLYAARCETAFTYGDLEFFGTRTGIFQPGDFSFTALARMAGTNPVTSLFHRNAWRTVGGYDEKLEGLEDVEFSIRLAARGICGQWIPGTTLRYRRHGESRHVQLEVGNRERLIAVRLRIEQKHWRAFQTMADCDRCPGSTGAGKGIGVSNNTNVGANGVDLQYIGPRIGSFTEAHAPISERRYLIEGRGTWVRVDPRDVEWLLGKSYGGQPEYRLPEVEQHVSANFSAPLPDTDLVDVTTLDETDALGQVALITDAIDLRVWLAQEQTKVEPRAAVIAAIVKRGAELGETFVTTPSELPDISTLNAKDAIEAIAALTSDEDVRALYSQESAREVPRKTVQDALAKREKELTSD